jgi:hypothetical protein
MGGECSADGEEKGVYRVWWGNLRERDPGVGARIILRWIFRKRDVRVWTGLGWLRIETGGGQFECGNEPSGYMNCGKFLY